MQTNYGKLPIEEYAKGAGEPMTADDLFNALALKFPPREYALLSQVRNCTGFGLKVRTADALVMSLWPSRGLELSGVEIKIERTGTLAHIVIT